MRRTGSGGGRVPSSLSARRDSPIPKTESSIPSTSGRGAPPISRTSSANTTTTARLLAQAAQTSPRPANAHLHKATNSKQPLPSPQRSPQPDPLSSPSESSESSSSESPTQSPFIRRPPKFHSNKMGLSEDADDDEEDEPAFMPFTSGEAHHDPSATLRGDPRGMTTRRTPTHKKAEVSQTSDSSASSTAPTTRRVDFGGKRPGPLSPRRAAELAGKSPGTTGKGRESEGSPSMGSSFSDLDGILLYSWYFMTFLTVYRHINHPKRLRRSPGKQHASGRRDGEQNEHNQPSSAEQISMISSELRRQEPYMTKADGNS